MVHVERSSKLQGADQEEPFIANGSDVGADNASETFQGIIFISFDTCHVFLISSILTSEDASLKLVVPGPPPRVRKLTTLERPRLDRDRWSMS